MQRRIKFDDSTTPSVRRFESALYFKLGAITEPLEISQILKPWPLSQGHIKHSPGLCAAKA
jgi:hypothetical protein